jgi:hypothetical protein
MVAPVFAALVLVSACGGGEVRQTKVVVENVTVNQQKTVVVEKVSPKPAAVVTNTAVVNTNAVVTNTPVTAVAVAPATIWVTNSYAVESDEKVLELANLVNTNHGAKRLAIAKDRIPGKYFTVLQSIWILSSIAEDEERFAVLNMLVSNLVDMDHGYYLIYNGYVPWGGSSFFKASGFYTTNIKPVSCMSLTNGNVITNFVAVQSIRTRKQVFNTVSEDTVWDLSAALPNIHGDKRLSVVRDTIGGRNLSVFQALCILSRTPEEDNYFGLVKLVMSKVVGLESRDHLSQMIPFNYKVIGKVRDYIKSLKE